MTTLLRATDSADFLAMVPALAGFTPRQSIVMLPFDGKRTHGAMRFDLPDDDGDLSAYVDRAVEVFARVRGSDALAVVVYTDDPAQHTRDGVVLPLGVLVSAILGLAEDLGFRIVDALCVTASGWASYLHDSPVIRPLAEIAATPVVPGLPDVSGDQHSGSHLPHVDLAEKERVGRALRELRAVLPDDDDAPPPARTHPQALASAAALDDLPGFFEDVLEEPSEPAPFVAATLLWCFDRPLLRDVALQQWATDLTGGCRALTAQLDSAEHATPVPEEFAEVFFGRSTRPDPERLQRALALVRAVSARAPRDSRPGPLTAAAWLSWALGRSTHAAFYLELVHQIDPDYGLAALVRTMIAAAMLPEWALSRAGSDADRTTSPAETGSSLGCPDR